MTSDIIQLYEINIKKNYDLLDSYISKSHLYEDEYLSSMISLMENLLLSLEKDTKYYTIELSLSNSSNNQNQKSKPTINSKIKQANEQLEQYKNILVALKDKQSLKRNYVISSPYEKNENENEKKDNKFICSTGYSSDEELKEKKISNDSFIKLEQGIRDLNCIENISGKVLNNLNSQSDQMKNCAMKVNFLNEDLNSSNNILVRMLGKENFDKKLIILLGMILLVILFSFLIYKIIKRFN